MARVGGAAWGGEKGVRRGSKQRVRGRAAAVMRRLGGSKQEVRVTEGYKSRG